MDYEGKIWPSPQDREPLVARFHVPKSPLGVEDYTPGTTGIIVTETAADAEVRLKERFPLYRLVRFGEQLIGRANSNEV